jgi:hypothetical protein
MSWMYKKLGIVEYGLVGWRTDGSPFFAGGLAYGSSGIYIIVQRTYIGTIIIVVMMSLWHTTSTVFTQTYE